ncbi:NXPE family member 3-like isoform X1 [Patiria miniata]|uniref:NXPE C-terminal domain-containing protein n=1 Tax=Patiria miniata TaxID=46514 RepID=A0A913ZB14_PATMI|nr:NXPE family member 3-like isoform X1 [Patiria miniata]
MKNAWWRYNSITSGRRAMQTEMAASSPGHYGDRTGNQNGGANLRKLPPGATFKVTKSMWYFAVFFMVAVGVDVVYYWQGSDVEPNQPQHRPVPGYQIRQRTSSHQSTESASRLDSDDQSSPATEWSTKQNAATSSFLMANPTPADFSTTRVATNAVFDAKALLRSYPTDALNSFFTIKNAARSSHYMLCDTLELHIEARDQHNHVKQHGGDYFWVKIFNLASHSSQPADEIIDHGNGTYTARFLLHWTGVVSMKVLLVASSEYAALLGELREAAPARFAYNGKFKIGNWTEIMPCHITKEMYLGFLEPERSRGFCDFSDRRLGYPWFCLKPRNLPCSSFVEHMGSLTRSREYNTLLFQGKQESLSHRFANIKQIGTTTIEVKNLGNRKEMTSLCIDKPLPVCVPGVPPRPPKSVAGFYHQTSWHSLVCSARDFKSKEALRCLQGRSLFFYGDSTLRQWFEYLTRRLGRTMREKRLTTSPIVGPRYAYDKAHNISMLFRIHGFPIRNRWLKVKDVAYAANEIDNLPGGPNTVIVMSLWAHFTPTTLQFYRDRWRAIKGALQRLRARAPGTLVLIKSANTREPRSPDMSNWYGMELDKVMREELSGEPGVTIIDVWDMTLSHSTGYRAHPLEVIISQEIKMLLSFVCPVP